MPTLTQMEYLVAVDKHRHFGKAAKECHVSQPTLSMQLQKMEEELEITFFDRTKQPILPNPQALPIIEQAKTILREYEKLKHITATQSAELSGGFKLAVIPTVAPYLLHRFIGDFSQKYPKIELSIHEMTTSEIIAAIHRDEIDAGILATPLNDPSLDERPLFYEPFQIFASKNHPLSKLKNIDEDDLPANDVWLLAEGHCLRGQVVKLCSAKKTSAVFKNVHFESGSLETIIQLVEQGHGYTLLPALAADSILRKNHPLLREFKKEIPTREISLVYQRSQYKQNILKALNECVREHLPTSVFLKRQPQMSVVQIKSH